MNKIKTILIHWLGGYTGYENYAQYRKGQKDTLTNACLYLQSLYGQPADEQLKQIWDFFNEK